MREALAGLVEFFLTLGQSVPALPPKKRATEPFQPRVESPAPRGSVPEHLPTSPATTVEIEITSSCIVAEDG